MMAGEKLTHWDYMDASAEADARHKEVNYLLPEVGAVLEYARKHYNEDGIDKSVLDALHKAYNAIDDRWLKTMNAKRKAEEESATIGATLPCSSPTCNVRLFGKKEAA
jgi:hypothetical protein